jgi:hypothetical protein
MVSDKRKHILKKSLFKMLYVLVNVVYLVDSLVIPWVNSVVYFYLKETTKIEWLASISILSGYFGIILLMLVANKITPNKKSFKKRVTKEFFSTHDLIKSSIIYILSVVFLVSNNQSFGIALLIPYYMYVINFYTSISSGEIKQGWF